MHRSLIILVSALLVAAVSLMSMSAIAQPKEPRDGKATRQRTKTPIQKPIARQHPDTSCGQFGAGFMRLPGSDSCVRFGGGVGMGVGAVP